MTRGTPHHPSSISAPWAQIFHTRLLHCSDVDLRWQLPVARAGTGDGWVSNMRLIHAEAVAAQVREAIAQARGKESAPAQVTGFGGR
jgi:hypothetical protein